MAKAFTKGEAATMISNWDGNGTFSFEQVIVHSCGAKRMVLTSEATGEELGRNFRPEVATGFAAREYHNVAVFKRMTDDEARAVALEHAAAFLAHKEAEFTRIMERNPGDVRYLASIERSRAELHEPRAVSRVEASEAVRVKVLADRAARGR